LPELTTPKPASTQLNSPRLAFAQCGDILTTAMPKLSIVIGCYGEFEELQQTIKSIRDTAGNEPEIVVIDDSSQIPLTVKDSKTVMIRNETRAGVGPSRHIGVTHATGDFVMLTDCHMRFEPGWYDKTMAHIEGRNTTLFCGSCIALSPGQMDLNKATETYHGATINFHGPDRHRPEKMQVLEGVWLKDREGDDYPLACCMGASYILSRDWFFHLHGLNMLRQWGGDEVLLSLKSWLAGGEVRMMKKLRVGHMFREKSHYVSQQWCLIYNAMMIALTCLPLDKAHRLNRLHQGSTELLTAKQRIEEDSGIIWAERAYLQSIFVRDFDWLLSYFGLSFPQ
jgi:glycosyltransferase involved in cell wall biosynthesis